MPPVPGGGSLAPPTDWKHSYDEATVAISSPPNLPSFTELCSTADNELFQLQGAYNSGKPGKLREFLNSGKLGI